MSVSDLEENPSGPVDDYDTFVAEMVLKTSGKSFNPNDFFQRYQVQNIFAGSSLIKILVSFFFFFSLLFRVDMLCILKHLLTQPVAVKKLKVRQISVKTFLQPSETTILQVTQPCFVEESQMYLDNRTELCEELFGTNTNSDCSDVSWNYEYNWAVDSCIGDQNVVCSSDGDDNHRDHYIGSISEPRSTSGKPKVTVWYNNQVCKLTLVHFFYFDCVGGH